MLVIDRLRLSLPPGFEHRARRVARLVADELAAGLATGPAPAPVAGNRRVDRLEVPAVRLAVGAGNRRLAGRVATAVSRRLPLGKGERP